MADLDVRLLCTETEYRSPESYYWNCVLKRANRALPFDICLSLGSDLSAAGPKRDCDRHGVAGSRERGEQEQNRQFTCRHLAEPRIQSGESAHCRPRFLASFAVQDFAAA